MGPKLKLKKKINSLGPRLTRTGEEFSYNKKDLKSILKHKPQLSYIEGYSSSIYELQSNTVANNKTCISKFEASKGHFGNNFTTL